MSLRTGLKNTGLVLAAAFVALLVPIIITPVLNRFVADLTHQWYLNDTSRIIITFVVFFITYGLAYLLIMLSSFRKSVLFNIVC